MNGDNAHSITSPAPPAPSITPPAPPAPGGDHRTVLVNKKDLASFISLMSRNDHSAVTGLKHYAGGRVTHPDHPSIVCAPCVRAWLRDIDARTAGNWDDTGRIDLARQHVLGAARVLIDITVDQHGYDWSKVKQALIDIFQGGETYYDIRDELVRSRRQRGETLHEFWVRLRDLVLTLDEEKPEHREAHRMDHVCFFLTALPRTFQTLLTEADGTQPLAVFRKALDFVKNNPELAEEEAGVAAAASCHRSQQASARPRAAQGDARRQVECFRCHRLGHIARHCRVNFCQNCGTAGHTAATCRRPSSGSGQGYRR